MVDLAAAHIRHDAVSARVVAASHDGDERGNLLVNCGNSVVEVLVGLAAIEQLLRHLAEIFDGLGSDDKIYERKPILEIFLRPFSCTTGDNNFSAGPFGLPLFEPADFGKRTIFGVL